MTFSLGPLGPSSDRRFSFLFVFLMVLATALPALGVDTDQDGRLDVLDVPQYSTSTTGTLVLNGLGIEDLDGLSEISPEVLRVYLGDNQITSIQQGDLTGLNTQYLYFYNNQIAEIEPHAFAGLTLRDLNLNNNRFSDLHLEGGTYEVLYHLGIDRADVKRLYLDEAQISAFSYGEVAREATEITDLSMVGMSFLGDPPETLQTILSLHLLRQVTVDQSLFDQYPEDFNQFAGIPGNHLSIVNATAELGDCNENGSLDFDDLHCVDTLATRDAVLSTLDLFLGDLDGNGRVAFDDFLTLATYFGQADRSYLEGNLNLDEKVGFEDFILLAEHFGSGNNTSSRTASAVVPEPHGWGIGAFAIAWLGWRVRRHG